MKQSGATNLSNYSKINPLKKTILSFVIICTLFGSSQAFAQTTNTEIGGPIVPNIPSTQTTYCPNGICGNSVSYFNGTVSGNDTANLESKARYNIIMVIPSELCTTALKNHVKTSCPPLANLTKYDNSNQHISGFFYNINGTIMRSNPQVKNHWQYYSNTNHTIVCVYCTGNYLTSDLYQTIIIEADNFEFVPHIFITRNDTNYIQNGTGNFIPIHSSTNEIDAGLTSILNRSMQGCDTATISYSDFLLNDTISYMESGCKITHYNKTNTQIVPNMPWVWNNPYSTLHYESDLQSIMHGQKTFGGNRTEGGIGPSDCIHFICDLTTSTKKPGW